MNHRNTFSQNYFKQKIPSKNEFSTVQYSREYCTRVRVLMFFSLRPATFNKKDVTGRRHIRRRFQPLPEWPAGGGIQCGSAP